MAITYLFAGVPTTHLDSALAWYERLLGRPPDGHPNENEAVWQLTATGLLYVVADSSRAGKALLTFIVDDLEDQVAALAVRGLAIGAIETVPGLYQKAQIFDPEGNRLTFAKLLSADD